MSNTPVSNISSPDQNAKEPEQSNEGRKKVKIFRHWVFFQSTNPLHNKNIYFQSQVNTPEPRKNKPVQSEEVRRKR